MKIKSSVSILFIVIGLLSAQFIKAEGNPASLLLVRQVKIKFVPSAAHFICNIDQQAATVSRATLLAEAEDSPGVYNIAVALQHKQQDLVLSCGVLVAGADREFEYVPGLPEVIKSNSSVWADITEIQERSQAAQVEFDRWQQQREKQEISLKRIRSDANVIGNLERINQSRQELSALEQEERGLRQDIETLTSFLKAAAREAKPANFERRKLMLTQQLEELTRLVSTVESQEAQRKQLSQSDLDAKMRLIEETRYENVNELESQWLQLKTARERLELEAAQGAPAGGAQPPEHQAGSDNSHDLSY